MRPYRIKHIQTGLYYRPGQGQNLSVRGKVYTTGNSALNYFNDFVTVNLNPNGRIYREVGENMKVIYSYREIKWNEVVFFVNSTDFEIEYIN